MRGYHIYSNIWEASVGEQLPCERETGKRAMSPVNRRTLIAIRLSRPCYIIPSYAVGHAHQYPVAPVPVRVRTLVVINFRGWKFS